MLAGKQCCFWRAGALDSNETWWEGACVCVGGGGAKLDTSVIRSALKGEKTERGGGRKRRESRRQRVWWKAVLVK